MDWQIAEIETVRYDLIEELGREPTLEEIEAELQSRMDGLDEWHSRQHEWANDMWDRYLTEGEYND